MVRIPIEEKASYLRDAVFAASDGIVTTFAVVAGAEGASFGNTVVLILGLANLFADGFSMAAGNYLGTKSEIEYQEASGNHDDGQGSPLRQGVVTFVAFNLVGILPLIPFVFDFPHKFPYSIAIVSVAMFSVGAARSRFIKKNWIRSGLEMLFIGGFAATVAYFTGELLKGITG
jgi:VIT1/CCC1 family predicted Fe2+/Mn2+ transporter